MALTDAELTASVKEDIRHHREHGASLNPYSTTMCRWSWNNGFDGRPMDALVDHGDAYRRGQMAAKLLKEGH